MTEKQNTVRHLKSSTCCLDTLPSDFLKTLFNSVKTDLQKIVNSSLLSAIIPKSQVKTAALKLLLNKRRDACFKQPRPV